MKKWTINLFRLHVDLEEGLSRLVELKGQEPSKGVGYGHVVCDGCQEGVRERSSTEWILAAKWPHGAELVNTKI